MGAASSLLTVYRVDVPGLPENTPRAEECSDTGHAKDFGVRRMWLNAAAIKAERNAVEGAFTAAPS